MPADEPTLSDIAVRAYSITSYGLLSERKIQSEFWSPAGESLEADGFEYVGDVDNSLNLPPTLLSKSRNLEPTMVAGVDDAIIILSLFIASGVGQWAVGKICDELWERKFRKPFARMLKRRRAEGFSDRPMTVSFGVWYDTDGVYIGATTTLTADNWDGRLAELIPEAQRRGQEWVEAHGVTKPVVMFPVQQGELAEDPTLLDSIPD